MKRITKALLFVGILGLNTSSLLAQTASQGAVQDQEFVIRKDRVLSLPIRLRPFDKLPVLPQPKGLDSFAYAVTPFFLPLPALVKKAEPLLKEDKPPEIDAYPAVVTLGYGNFQSPLVEARYGSIASENWHYASRFFHQGYGKGPVTSFGEESPESHTALGGQGSYFFGNAEVFSDLSLSRDRYTFYGEELVWYDLPNAMLLRPFFDRNNQDRGQFSLGIRDVEKVDQFGYEAKLMLQGFKDSFLAREQEFRTQGKVNFRPADDWIANLGLAYFSTATKDATYDLTRNYLSIRPELTHTRGDLRVTAGVNLVAENDSLAEGEKGLRFFPLLKSQYQLSEQLGLYATLSGDVQRNTYSSFVQENPFLGPSTQLRNTVTKLKVGLGVEGQLWERLQYSTGLDISRQSNLHFFVNSFSDTSRFEIVYDKQVTVFQFNTLLEFKVSEIYALQTRVDLFQYALTTQQAAWHRPTWMISMNHQLIPVDKVRVQANINLMGGLIARGFESVEIISTPKVEEVVLNPILDLQLKVDYAVSSRISIFAEGNNLINRNNTRWMNYPVRGIQGLVGLSFKF